MSIVQRIWPREPVPSPLDLSLAERLKRLSEQAQSQQTPKAADSPASPTKTVPAPAAVSDPGTTGRTDPEEKPAPAVDVQPGEQEQNAPAEVTAADPGSAAEEAAEKEAISAESHSETPATEKSTLVADEQEAAAEAATESENGNSEQDVTAAEPTPEPANTESCTGQAACEKSEPEETGNGDRAKEAAQSPDPSMETRQEAAPIAHTAPYEMSAPPSPPKSDAAPNGGEPAGENLLASMRQELAELQTARQELEIEIRDRLDVAIADYERRLTSETLASEAAGQFEGRTKQATDKIFREVKEQAWTMLNAVAGELRTFRDQFGKEIQERSGNLEATTRQAMQVREKLEETLPIAEEILHSLPLAGQEAAAQVQAATAAITEQLNSSHQALSLEIENQKNSFKSLLQDCHQDEMRLKEEVEKFRAEVVAASELPGRMADESLESLRAGADEVDVRLRSGLESLAAQIEHHLLSPELVDKATAQIETAAQQQVIEPALERIRNVSAEAGTAAEFLQNASDNVVGRLGAARQQIETRLEALMSKQQNLLESSMNGLHRKAAEELGNVVEHVVAQSSQQLDDRLHALFDNLLSSTSEQINGMAHATLSTLHDGLKDVFEPESAVEATASGVYSQVD